MWQECHGGLRVLVCGATRRVSESMLSTEGAHLPKLQITEINTLKSICSSLVDKLLQIGYIVCMVRFDGKGPVITFHETVDFKRFISHRSSSQGKSVSSLLPLVALWFSVWSCSVVLRSRAVCRLRCPRPASLGFL